jgi:PAS domain S-box-containing protein
MKVADWQHTPFTFPLLLSGLLCGWVAYVSWRRRAVPGAAPAALLMGALAGWALVNLVEKSLVHHDLRRAISAFVYVFIVAVPAAWLVFTARFARLDRWLPRRLIPLLFLEPVLSVALALTNPYHGLFYAATEMKTDGPYAVMAITYGPLFFVHAAYAYLLLAAGAGLLVVAVCRQPGRTVGRIAVLLGAMLVPIMGNVAYVFRWQPQELTDLTPVYFAVTGLAAVWLLFRGRIFDVLPIARDFVLDCLGDAVLVLDTRLCLLDANLAAQSLLADRRPLQKLPLADALPELRPYLQVQAGAARAATEIQLALAGPARFWDVHVLPLVDHGVTIGTLVRLTDVTERRRAAEVRSQLAALVASSEDAIIGGTLDGGIVSWNPAAERLYGYTADEVRGRPFSLLCPPEDPNELPAVMEQLRLGKRVEPCEVVHVRKDGRRVDVSLSFSAIKDAAGAVTGASAIGRDVTDRKRAEAELRAAESRFRQLAENIHGVFWMADARKPQMLFISPAYEEIWGRTCQSLYEQPQSFLEAIHPEDRERVREAVRRQRQGKYTKEEYRVVRPDGSTCWVWDRGFPIKDQDGQVYWVGGIAEDITARKQAEEAVAASERRFRALVENTWDGVTLVAADGTILYTNPAILRNLGYAPEELVDRDGFELMHPDDRPHMRGLLAELLQEPGATRTAQYRMRHRDGSWRWREGTGTSLLAEPSVRAVVLNYRDITERRRLEEELRQRAEQLAQADRRKDEFLAMLAHELRNPLAPIRTALEVAKVSGATAARAEQAWQVIDRQVRQLVRLVDDLLDVSRITHGQIQLRTEPVELPAVVEAGLETSRPLIEARRHELTISLPSEPLWLQADLTRLAQVCSNLLNNAAKYTEEGGRIWLTAQRQGNELVLRVRDTGIGMTPEMLAQAFDLFTQADRSLDRSQGGLGIGLTLVRSLVRLHGGSVQAFSDGPGKGSEFVVRLPVLEGVRPADPAPPQGSAAGPCRRILVVDDNADAANTLAYFLGMSGHEVRTAYSGPAALAAAQAYRPEVVLLDLGMPGMDGYEVARRLRREPGLNNVLLVALTGYGHEEDRRLSREATINHHLVKPVEPEALQALLRGRESPPGGAS